MSFTNSNLNNYAKQKCYTTANQGTIAYKYTQLVYDYPNLPTNIQYIDSSLTILLRGLVWCDSAIKFAVPTDTLGKFYAFKTISSGIKAIKYARKAREELDVNERKIILSKALFNISFSIKYAYLAAQNFNGNFSKDQQIIVKADLQNFGETKMIAQKQEAIVKRNALTNQLTQIEEKLVLLNNKKGLSAKELNETRLLRTEKNIIELDLSDIGTQIDELVMQEERDLKAQRLSNINNSIKASTKNSDLVNNKNVENKNQIEKIEIALKNSNTKTVITDNTVVNKSAITKDTINKVLNSGFNKSIDNSNSIKDTSSQIVLMPMGLNYKIQIGTFATRIPEEKFKGLTPIEEKQNGDKFIYIVGNFKTYENAKEAKNYVIKLGFTDAFIRAFYNREIITVQEALLLENPTK